MSIANGLRLGLPVLIAGALLLGGCVRSEAHYAAQMDSEAETNPELGGLRDADPEFYAEIRGEVSRRLAAGEDQQIVASEAARRVNARFVELIRNLPNAPAESQLATFRAERQLMIRLQPVDSGACAAVFNGTLQEGAIPEAGHAEFRRNIAVRMQAARAGRDQPSTHPALTDADGRAFVQALLAGGLTQTQVEAFGYGRPIAPDAAGQCEAGLRIFNAIDQLDPAVRERVIAQMMSAFAEMAAGRIQQRQAESLRAFP